MELKTKFSIGDRVYYTFGETETRQEVCPHCHGQKHVEINGGRYICDNCLDGYIYSYPTIYNVHMSTIGQIRVQIDQEKDEQGKPTGKLVQKNVYMLKATGIDSGTLWNEDHLFITKDECQAFADELQKENEEMYGKR